MVDRAQGRAAYGAAAATRCGNRLRRTGSRLCTTVIRMRCREQTLLMLLLLLLLSSSASEGGSTSIDKHSSRGSKKDSKPKEKSKK